ncbi:MAG TPA: FliA/WhiG family RNA polymerase sigma factor [Syntrophales bacterium]|nr:FliA/WhiG family RNA polymerase sigma factor [Syntrophales bacterium]HPX10983.1 FliA/WhiG family RNA polymerase sigma factor [Syntrophales bacterium]HQB29480.1 FliA/WhiG family RNA polymerase sigma factor [Syntrophales bacterium]HQN77666.1 FliA/WhiG family RNA polymerase sigma factor [Syntrophales bacterium]HQQ26582.1 FliA/WhiG family RNA polymerase sigma factor [Syntrophales bacterium]
MEASVSSGNKTSFKAGDKKARNEAVLQYAPLVRNIVERIALKIPIREADREDLVNVGMMGLMSAVEKFDEKRNVQFKTYATYRIRGAVLDELRARDWVPRSVRSTDNKLEEAFSFLQRSLGKPPSDEEMADHLGIPLDGYYRMLDEVRAVSFISTEDLPPDYLERYNPADMLHHVDEGNPFDMLSGKELRKKLKDAIEILPEKERLVLALYYYEELTMKEIGKVMSLTESRVCQLHSKAILRLRGSIKDL